LSQEQVLKTLANLGFDQVDAQIFIYLSKKGMQKANDVCKALKLTKQQIYPSLKRLQGKGIVSSTIEHPARFSALPFEEVLDLFIKAKIEETRSLQQSKPEILSIWQNLKLEDDASAARFTVIEGRNYIYSKIQHMIQEARKQVLAITTIPTLAQADQRDIFDYDNYHNTLASRVQFRFLAELTEQSAHVVKALLRENENSNLIIEGRNPDLGLRLFPQMLVRDDEEALFFTKPRTEASIIEKDDVCLWTDCKSLTKAFTTIFEELWLNSTDIQEKMVEIETGEPTPRTLKIADSEIAKKKYNETLQSAKEEILVLTSSKGLVGLSKDSSPLNCLAENGVTVKIMAPIVGENLEAAKHLSSSCSVKHAPPNYMPTTIIDGKHLFQFTASTPRKMLSDSILRYENMLYTTDPRYIQKTRTMLLEIWKNSTPPSSDNLNSIFGRDARSQSAYYPGPIRSPGPDGTFQPLPPRDLSKKDSYTIIQLVNEDPCRKLKEQDVLNEIINSHKFRKGNRSGLCKIYSSQAIAVIHPPDFFKLPPMLIRIHHIEKQSTFGGEDAVIINLWQETHNGHAYMPVAVFSDGPKAPIIWGKHFGATPAGRNVQLAKKDELQVWVHGNTLFAGWTVPITLCPPEYVLPPACILFEGYGNVKTEAYSIIQPSGGKFTARQNGLDAFVTFMHPSSKYSGPGTDGFLVRDYVMDMTPQFLANFHPTLETKLIEKGKP
jgi:sugar-specific transcriptional regulator TrmB